MDDAAMEMIEEGEEEVHAKKMAEDCGVSGSYEDSDWDGLFRCLHCEEVFEEEAGYLEHQHLHPQDSPLDCPDTVSHVDGLLVSKDDGQQTCSICGRVFSDSRGFHSHMMKHRAERSKGVSVTPHQSSLVTKQNIYKCQDCGKSYVALGHFLNHQRSHKQASKSVSHLLAHLKTKSFNCHTCGRSYSRASALDAHRRCHEVKLIKSRNKGGEKTMAAGWTAVEREDKDEPVTLNTMRCHDCGKKFTSWEAFKTHLRVHALEEEGGRRRIKNPRKAESQIDAEEPVPDKEPEASSPKTAAKQRSGCGDVDVDGTENEEDGLGSPRELKASPVFTKERGNVARSRKAYICSICGKVYSYLESFKNHQTLHEQESLRNQDYKCSHCGKFFVRPSFLLAHLKEHEPTEQADEPAPKCDLCKREFASRQSWLVHLEVHKKKPYWCLSCSKGFKDEDSLNQHLRNHELKPHKCDKCFKTFRVEAELRYHYNTHTGNRPYKCVICKKRFYKLATLITHRKKHIAGHFGSDKTPLGSNSMNSKRRVSKLTKLIFSDMSKAPNEGEEEEEGGSENVASNLQLEEEETTRVFGQKEWGCFECSMSFDLEHELHQHYMRHARGEVPV